MSKHFKDYFWDDGFPYGREETEPQGVTYKIVADPYNKWVSVEKYEEGAFKAVVYDSHLLDFRKLHPAEQIAWERVVVTEEMEKRVCLVRNQDDRALFFETHTFLKGEEQVCILHSTHGFLLAIQKIVYENPFDGVILFDANSHPVLCKKYLVDEKTKEFTELVEEQWDFEKSPIWKEKLVEKTS